MAKRSFTHYYVQAQENGGLPQIVMHTYNETTQEHYHKFIDRKKALELIVAEKKATPDVKFRVVKCTETFDTGDWV